LSDGSLQIVFHICSVKGIWEQRGHEN
jgi:hypothetical protein